jgi:hypothetical protein
VILLHELSVQLLEYKPGTLRIRIRVTVQILIRIRIIVKTLIRIRITVKIWILELSAQTGAVDAPNGGVEAQNGGLEGLQASGRRFASL